MECGCGRSPTGKCVGWHKLSEDEYLEKLKEYQDKDKKSNSLFCSSQSLSSNFEQCFKKEILWKV